MEVRHNFSGPDVDRQTMIRIFSTPPNAAERASIRMIKSRIGAMIRERDRRITRDRAMRPSAYWSFFADAFNYLYALPPDQYHRLRLHTYHIDGVTYLNMFFSFAEHYASCLRYLQRDLPRRYWLAAPKACGEHGHVIDGQLINESTIRWQKLVKSLHLAGVLKQIGRRKRPAFLEIGGGYGSLANYFHSLFPQSIYVIVDLPETLLYSASYLSLIHGADRVLLAESGCLTPGMLRKASFVLVPNYDLSLLDSLQFDLALNVMSFQEMTPEQIRGYLAFVSSHAQRFLSWNHDRNHFSADFISVPDLLREFFPVLKPLPDFTPHPLIREALYGMPAQNGLHAAQAVFIFGAGAAGKKCLQALRRGGRYRIAGFIDNNSARWGGKVSGVAVHPPDRLRKRDWDYLFIASSAHAEIVPQLESMGFSEIDDFAVYEAYTYPPPIRRYDPLMRTIHDEMEPRILALPRRKW